MMQDVIFEDLGNMKYKDAWDYQEQLLRQNVAIKSFGRTQNDEVKSQKLEDNVLAVDLGSPDWIAARMDNTKVDSKKLPSNPTILSADLYGAGTKNYLLFVEHPPVYTLGKSGHAENLLLNEQELNRKQIEFFRTNRGGDITFHGPGQIVGYPILDLENFYTDIGRYLRNLEEVIILTLKDYSLKGERSPGETGVWLQPDVKGKERKICAMGVRCSRWITMHGFAFNINTDLDYFNHIIPCGIQNKSVTSLQKELGEKINLEEVKLKLKKNFEHVFEVRFI